MATLPPTPAKVDEFLRNERKGTNKALCPKQDFYRLGFPHEVSTHARWGWKNKFRIELRYDVTIPSKKIGSLKYIYIRRQSKDIICKLMAGDYGQVKFVDEDEPPENKTRKKNFREFIARGFPLDEDQAKIKSLLGDNSRNIHRIHRFKANNHPAPPLLIVWKNETQNPPEYIKLYPDFPDDDSPWIRLKEREPRLPTCFLCNIKGHISKYCKNTRSEHQDLQATGNATQEEKQCRMIFPLKKKHTKTKQKMQCQLITP